MSKSDAAILSMTESDKVRFEGKITRLDNGCWHFEAPAKRVCNTYQKRFALWDDENKVNKVLAHRASFWLYNGVLPPYLMHTCSLAYRDGSCVNPEHLRPGTHAENLRDYDFAKLTYEEIPVIRRMLAEGIRQTEIAACFGVNGRTISSINTGKTWVGV